MTTLPNLTPALLFRPAELKTNTSLANQIITLSNAAFKRSKEPQPEKWRIRPRFPSLEAYHEQMLVDDAIVAVILDQSESFTETSEILEREGRNVSGKSKGKVVACAAAVPWTGGWHKEGASTETGFEIKALAVDGSPKYLRKGLAVQVMAALEDELVRMAKEREARGTVQLWILAAECINGEYWKRRGYTEVRRSTEGDLTWGCWTNFELVVFRRDVEFRSG